jgi:nicotinamidase-related amidase
MTAETGADVLVVIDVQGKLARLMHDHPVYLENIVRMVRGARLLGVPVVWAEQNPGGLGETVPEVAAALEGLRPIPKTTFSCGADPTVRDALRATACRRAFLVGIEAHICVFQTAVDLLDDGWDVEIVTDAVSARTPANAAVGIDRMRSAGARPTSVEMALYGWLGSSDHPRFRDVLTLVR